VGQAACGARGDLGARAALALAFVMLAAWAGSVSMPVGYLPPGSPGTDPYGGAIELGDLGAWAVLGLVVAALVGLVSGAFRRGNQPWMVRWSLALLALAGPTAVAIRVVWLEAQAQYRWYVDPVQSEVTGAIVVALSMVALSMIVVIRLFAVCSRRPERWWIAGCLMVAACPGSSLLIAFVVGSIADQTTSAAAWFGAIALAVGLPVLVGVAVLSREGLTTLGALVSILGWLAVLLGLLGVAIVLLVGDSNDDVPQFFAAVGSSAAVGAAVTAAAGFAVRSWIDSLVGRLDACG